MRRQRGKNLVSLHNLLRSGVSVGRERKSPGGREQGGDVRRKGGREQEGSKGRNVPKRAEDRNRYNLLRQKDQLLQTQTGFLAR